MKILFALLTAILILGCQAPAKLQTSLPKDYIKVQFPNKAVAYLNKADTEPFLEYLSETQSKADINYIRRYLMIADSAYINRRLTMMLVSEDSAVGLTLYNGRAQWAVLKGRIAIKDSSGVFVKSLERRK